MPWLLQQYTLISGVFIAAFSVSIYILPYHMKLEALITHQFCIQPCDLACWHRITEIVIHIYLNSFQWKPLFFKEVAFFSWFIWNDLILDQFTVVSSQDRAALGILGFFRTKMFGNFLCISVLFCTFFFFFKYPLMPPCGCCGVFYFIFPPIFSWYIHLDLSSSHTVCCKVFVT